MQSLKGGMAIKMDFDNRMEKEKELPEQPQTLISAEAEEIVVRKRDRLCKRAMVAAVVFCVVAAALMASFKFNEDFFDASSRLGLLMESVNAQEENSAYPKINVKAEFDDKEEAKLVIPLNALADHENITIHEEFTRNKLVVTLKGGSGYIPDGIRLTSDSRIMDAVGIYRQNLDVVVEVYCKETYSYTVENGENALSIHFLPLRSSYDAVAVVYIPYEDRNRLKLPEWHQSLADYVSDNRIRLFMASDMQEPYTQQDVIQFAEHIDADVVLGIDVSVDAQAQETSAAAICNTTYFIPDFNSAHLAVILAEEFVSETQLPFWGFDEADGNTPLVALATRPSAMLKISQSQKDAESVEAVYKLNERIVAVIKNTLGSIYTAQG